MRAIQHNSANTNPVDMKKHFSGRQRENEPENIAPRIERPQESSRKSRRRPRNKRIQSSIKTKKIYQAKAGD